MAQSLEEGLEGVDLHGNGGEVRAEEVGSLEGLAQGGGLLGGWGCEGADVAGGEAEEGAGEGVQEEGWGWCVVGIY